MSEGHATEGNPFVALSSPELDLTDKRLRRYRQRVGCWVCPIQLSQPSRQRQPC